MKASTTFLQAVLEQTWLDYQKSDPGATIEDALVALRSARMADTIKGRQIIATSKSGHSVTFSAPGASALSPQDLAELAQDLLGFYRRVFAENPTLSQQELLNLMVSRLRPIRRYQHDFSYLRH